MVKVNFNQNKKNALKVFKDFRVKDLKKSAILKIIANYLQKSIKKIWQIKFCRTAQIFIEI